MVEDNNKRKGLLFRPKNNETRSPQSQITEITPDGRMMRMNYDHPDDEIDIESKLAPKKPPYRQV